MATAEPPTPSSLPQSQQQSGGLLAFLQQIGRVVLIYWIIQSFFGNQAPKNSTPRSQPDTPADKNITSRYVSQYDTLWDLNTPLDLHVYVSDSSYFTTFNDKSALIWTEKNFLFGDWNVYKEQKIDLPLSQSAQNNGTVFAHIYVTKHGSSPNPTNRNYAFLNTVYKRIQLNKYMARRQEEKGKSLLDGTELYHTQEVPEIATPAEQPNIISYWKGNLTLNLVAETAPIHPKQLPPHMTKHIQVINPSDPQSEIGNYFPTLYLNEFWTMERQFIPINATTSTVPLYLRYYPISMTKFQLYVTMTESFQMQRNSFGSSSSELDEIKRMLLETNPYFLALTMLVSLLHSLFDFLAFKNDIQFWRNKEDVQGISVRSILLNVFFQIVIFLYLVDNQKNTSYMILMSQGIGLLIEIWKAKKAVSVKVDWSRSIPRIGIENKKSYTESKTKEYDDLAFKYLSWALYPLLLGYAIYSLIYDKHKSWYSFILNMMVGFVYTFGFIMQTPQLFINWKLKSVAHLNGRVLTYKFLNTIVDDLFAFIITMPTLHRLAAFRDDVIFVVYLYQRWIYPVDKSRTNEYGQIAEDSKSAVVAVEKGNSKIKNEQIESQAELKKEK